jgi:hypothetical protein
MFDFLCLVYRYVSKVSVLRQLIDDIGKEWIFLKQWIVVTDLKSYFSKPIAQYYRRLIQPIIRHFWHRSIADCVQPEMFGILN